MHLSFFNQSWSGFASGMLIAATGGMFVILCTLLLVVESVIKILALPVIFLLGVGALSFGFVKRKFTHV